MKPTYSSEKVSPLPESPASWSIISICVFVFVIANLARLADPSGLCFSPGNGQLFPQILTYMFVHHDIAHLLANLLGLYVFGKSVEQSYGTWPFLLVFIVAGLAAALAQGLVDSLALLAGASGGIAGVMAAFLRARPFARLYLYGILPLPAWLLILVWLAYNIMGVQKQDSTIAFAAHLAGFAVGLVLTLALRLPREAREDYEGLSENFD